MSAAIKQVLFNNWHLMRWLRLALGLFIMVQAIRRHDGFAGAIAVFLLFQAVTNTGCCGSGSCGLPGNNQTTKKPEELLYEEVK
jgi:hypothetical protein